MSFLKKGLLANYITDNRVSLDKDGNGLRNPNYMNYNGKYRKVWNGKKYADSIKFIFENELGFAAVFRFSVSPQSVEITYPQRVFETKTFGGSVIEDYGNDTANITIQGSTINSDIRYYVCNPFSSEHELEENGSGIDELLDFKNLLETWGNVDYRNGKKVKIFYDNLQFAVNPKEFTIKQSKDNPLAYAYTINLIGTDETHRQLDISDFDSGTSFKEKLNELYAKFENFVKTTENYLSVLEAGLEYFEDFKDICATIRAADIRLEKALNNLVNQILAYVDEVSTCLDESTNLKDLVISSGIRVGLGTVDKAFNSAQALVEAIDHGLKFFEDFKDTYGKMSSDIQEHWEMTGEKIVETCKYMMVSSKEKAEELLADIQQSTSTCDAGVVPGDKNSSDEIIFIYGVKEYTVCANDTWDSLSLKFYGNAAKATLLSSYNNQKLNAQADSHTGGSETTDNNGMPSSGTKIYIPVLENSSGFNGNNQVFNLPDVVDNYGHDIRLTSDGDFDFHNGDIATTEGLETLSQAIINRLSTTVGSRIRDSVYGIRTNIGSTDNTIQLVISSSIESTLISDPRIKSVDDIEFTGNGDRLNVSVSYTDINDCQRSIGGIF